MHMILTRLLSSKLAASADGTVPVLPLRAVAYERESAVWYFHTEMCEISRVSLTAQPYDRNWHTISLFLVRLF